MKLTGWDWYDFSMAGLIFLNFCALAEFGYWLNGVGAVFGIFSLFHGDLEEIDE